MVKDTGVLLVLCEGSQLCVHEGKEFSFGELSVVPSFPLYFWKTAIRDSMHLSVSVGILLQVEERGPAATVADGGWDRSHNINFLMFVSAI